MQKKETYSTSNITNLKKCYYSIRRCAFENIRNEVCVWRIRPVSNTPGTLCSNSCFLIFQNGGLCFTSANASNTYSKYGEAKTCKANGKGGPWGNQVYEIVKVGQGANHCLREPFL